jgi:hypothetical protein
MPRGHREPRALCQDRREGKRWPVGKQLITGIVFVVPGLAAKAAVSDQMMAEIQWRNIVIITTGRSKPPSMKPIFIAIAMIAGELGHCEFVQRR